MREALRRIPADRAVRASAPQPDDETGPEDDREELCELVELDFDYLEGIGAPDGMPSGLGEATGALGEAPS